MKSATDYNPATYTVGEQVRIAMKFPVGHYRVPMYMRGRTVTISKNLGRHINPEEEAFGRNAGNESWYYMVRIPQTELWQEYNGPDTDMLEIEIFENWLEPIKKDIT
ncbi:nitrile hydratase subunit beta [Flavobacterium sp. MAH-1]|uniref:Nitrile hydratase subunit beta n=1 Tax=Flavobacterium agri TaxID=2743471 RepID=A0A7Y9C491_9FLAO|nr:SH3-like domain-containing protein [Flavobacterium agri]NUY79635.1 nitrile hydratase subunit beta [Flavobacterium agri]NYA69660.1 nitrile hydratase subunit beta [Flavobacterium agri]